MLILELSDTGCRIVSRKLKAECEIPLIEINTCQWHCRKLLPLQTGCCRSGFRSQRLHPPLSSRTILLSSKVGFLGEVAMGCRTHATNCWLILLMP